MFKALGLVRDILKYGSVIYKKIVRAIKVKKVKDAFDESENNQRGIEEILGGTSGNPTGRKYDGLLTRKSKRGKEKEGS